MKKWFIFLAIIIPNKMLYGQKVKTIEIIKIMGINDFLVDSSIINVNSTQRFSYKFCGIGSNKNYCCECLIEKYKKPIVALKTYTGFYNSNKGNTGFENLQNIHYQSFYQPDLSNFAIMIAQKNQMLIRMKIKKLPRGYSRESMIEYIGYLINTQ